MTLQINGNNNFEFITYNYDPSLVDSINVANNDIEQDDVRNIISPPDGNTPAHPHIANIDEFKKQFYTSPFINMSQGASIQSEKAAYEDLLEMGALDRDKAIPPYPGSLVTITGNTTDFVRSRFDYDKLINIIVQKFNNVGKIYNPEDIANILNGNIGGNHEILTELDMDADDFCKAIFQLPVKNFNELGLYSEVFSINSLINANNATASSLAIPSFDTISPENPTITFLPDFTNNTTPLNVTLTDDVVKWEYSVDKGSSWTTINVIRDNDRNITSETSFTLADNTYIEYDIGIRAYDYTGNSSTTWNGNTVVVKSTPPTVVSARLLSNRTSIEIIFDDTIDLAAGAGAASNFNFNQSPSPDITEASVYSVTESETDTPKLVLTINTFTIFTTPLTIGFNTNKIKDKYGNTIDIANQNIFIEQNVELYLNKITGDLYYKTTESNINVFQLNFDNVNITSISEILTDFNVVLGGNGKSMVGYANNTTTNLAQNAWTKLLKITSGNLNNIALANSHNIFTDGTIIYNTIGFTLASNIP